MVTMWKLSYHLNSVNTGSGIGDHFGLIIISSFGGVGNFLGCSRTTLEVSVLLCALMCYSQYDYIYMLILYLLLH